jgi:phospholipase/carboxylesterase
MIGSGGRGAQRTARSVAPDTRPARRTGSGVLDRRGFLRWAVGGLAAGALSACDGPLGLEGGDGDPRLRARPGTPSAFPEYGPHPLGLAAGRDGVLFVPGLYTPETPMPLLVALHGAGGAAENWSGFHTACEGRGLLLLAVDSRGATWDRVQGTFGDDVRFIDRALTHTFERCNVDPERIALIGFSDGASYALSLGLCNGDLFTHLVAYSPGHSEPTGELVGKPRVFVSHGKSDAILPVTRSRAVIVPELQAAGYDVTYVEFEGGHQVPQDIGSASLDWFES